MITDFTTRIDYNKQNEVFGKPVEVIIYRDEADTYEVERTYRVYKIPKKSGGFRQIEEPNDGLKVFLRKVYEQVAFKMPISPMATAFAKGRNIAHAAMPHVGKPFVLSFDLSDFFPSIKLAKFSKLKDYKALPSLEQQLIGLCFEDFKDGKELRLPQGSPASPFLSNVFMNKFDWIGARIAANFDESHRMDFTRYADDVIISGDSESLLWRVFHGLEGKLKHMGLQVNPKKTRIKSSKQRQEVCGLVVNKKLQPPVKWRKRLRAALHEARHSKKLCANTAGRKAFLDMVKNATYRANSIAVVDAVDTVRNI